MTLASIKAQYVVLVPVAESAVPAGCLFLDSANANQMTVKGTDSIPATVNTGGGGGTNYFITSMIASGPIAIRRPLNKRADGKVSDAVATNSDNRQNICGYSLTPSASDGDVISVLCVGPNLADALVGLGFATGDEIYLSDAGGYTNTTSGLSAGIDSIIKLGVADCASGTASATATDLIGFSDVVSR